MRSPLQTAIGSVALLILVGKTSANAETLYYGSRAGMVVTVVGKTGLDSTHARILTKHTRDNAVAFCREYVGKVTPKCIADELKVILTPTIEANCSTGKFTTLAGSGYQFIGSNPRFDPTDSSENPAFLIAPVDEKEPLKDYANTGYVTVLEQFKALCPGRLR